MTEPLPIERERKLMAMYDPLGLLRYGAPELKRLYIRNLGIAFGISVAVHLALLALLFLPGTDAPRPPELIEVKLDTLPLPKNLPQVVMGDQGSSGALNKEPKGPAMRGDPHHTPDPFLQNNRPVISDIMVKPKDMKPVTGRPVPSNRETARPTPTSPVERDSTAREHGSTGSVGGGAGGTGTHGVGGGGTGSVTDGLGMRGWASRAVAKYPEGSNATGTVKLKFTVMPDGEITNVIPIQRADQALVDAAVRGLRRARANPLPENVPQVPQSSWISFSFVLK